MNVIINNNFFPLSQDEVKFFYGTACSGKSRVLEQIKLQHSNTTILTFDFLKPSLVVESVVQLESIQQAFSSTYQELFRALDPNFYDFIIQNGQVLAISNGVTILPQDVSHSFRKIYYLFFYVEILHLNSSSFPKVLIIDDLGEMFDPFTFSSIFEKLLFRCKIYNIQLFISGRRKSELDLMLRIIARVNSALPSSFSSVNIGFYHITSEALIYYDIPSLPDLINVAI